MKMASTTKDVGLRGVKVADTSISLIDGELGHLYFRGYDVHDLVQHSTYEEVAYLLLYNELPKSAQLKDFSGRLVRERRLPDEVISAVKALPKTAYPMDVLQAAVPMLASFDPELLDDSKDANRRKATRLIAKIPTIVASWDRIRKGLQPIPPHESLSRSANFLYMLKGEVPNKETQQDFDICMILHAEHSFNASTFAARVVASTRAHAYASVAAATGALSGELHGGANSQVMKNLLEIEKPEAVEPWVKAQLDQDKRIMGMGHAIYRVIDPRASVLKEMSERLAQRTGELKWYTVTKKVEEVTEEEFRKRKRRKIYPNVDLYSASVYYMMGIPPDLYTAIFAVSRVAGWMAHVIEEKFPESPLKPMLYRPSSDYRGNYCGQKGCRYVPMNERS